MITSFVKQYPQQGEDYIKLLSAISKLSGLFSEGTIPYINYRVAENVFCRSFGAENLSRSDTAFDAKIGTLGIGLKTFICSQQKSIEKVAEFNTLSAHLREYRGTELARELANCRNERIQLAYDLYGIDSGIYHIVARRDKELLLFETDYDFIHRDKIKVTKEDTKSLVFTDGINEYRFNFSKSTLYRSFSLPNEVYRFPVEILQDPYQILLELYQQIAPTESKQEVAGIDYILLPLYSTKKGIPEVQEKSGLNQWNAGGRKRDYGEIYIPVPRVIHKYCSGFFPDRDVSFTIKTPRGEQFSAKLCQDGAKALMTNPNNALSNWLLRGLCKLDEGKLLTYKRLELLGFDCVIIRKTADLEYSIDVQGIGMYEEFIDLLQSV